MTSRSSSVLCAPAYSDAVRAWYDAADTLLQPWRDLLQAKGTRPAKDPTACAGPCDCCVPDADVLVHARAGERRVVPLLLTNPGRRPMTVTVDVGAFSPCGSSGDISVDARVVPDTEVQLAACGRETVELVLEIGRPGTQHDSQQQPGTATAAREDAVVAIHSGRVLRRTDEQCSTLVSDVRFVGCGSRALRIGVIVLPAACDAYEVRCDCGCC